MSADPDAAIISLFRYQAGGNYFRLFLLIATGSLLISFNGYITSEF